MEKYFKGSYEGFLVTVDKTCFADVVDKYLWSDFEGYGDVRPSSVVDFNYIVMEE